MLYGRDNQLITFWRIEMSGKKENTSSKICVLIGKTASGKDTLARYMCENLGYERIVTYTTRPMREREVQNKSYHFISPDRFDRMVENNEFAEYKAYNPAQGGTWKYGSKITDDMLNDGKKHIIILTPAGYRDVQKYFNGDDRIKSVYIEADNDTLRKRLLHRGDDPKEAERRLESDDRDFRGVEEEANAVIRNTDRDIKKTAEEIDRFITGDRTLIVMTGLPGSGKSTKAEELAEKYNAVIISTDEIRQEINGDAGDQRNAKKVFDTAFSRLDKALVNGKNIIWDSTNLDVHSRRAVVSHVDNRPYRKISVCMDVPKEICKERNKVRYKKLRQAIKEGKTKKSELKYVPDNVIDRMAGRLTMPDRKNGYDEFDEVITVDEHGKKKTISATEQEHKSFDISNRGLSELEKACNENNKSKETASLSNDEIIK